MGLKAHCGAFCCEFSDNAPHSCYNRALCAGEVVISCCSFNFLRVKNIQSVHFKISLTFAGIESNGGVNAHPAGVVKGAATKAITEAIVHF